MMFKSEKFFLQLYSKETFFLIKKNLSLDIHYLHCVTFEDFLMIDVQYNNADSLINTLFNIRISCFNAYN